MVHPDLHPARLAAIHLAMTDEGLQRWLAEGQQTDAALERALTHFWTTQADAATSGDEVWQLQEPLLGPEHWSARAEETWLRLTTSNLPGAVVSVRLGLAPEGVVCTALLVERGAGEVTARDLRALRIRPLLDVALAPMREAVRSYTPAARPARPGNVGYDLSHWEQVYLRYQRARQVDRRRFVQVMLEDYEPSSRPSDATMRRWVRKVEQLLESGLLPSRGLQGRKPSEEGKP